MLVSKIYCSPIGNMLIRATEVGICGLTIGSEPALQDDLAQQNPFIRQAIEQLDAYFAGVQKHFDLPLDLQGTPFQQRVWQELQRIPFGHTITYAQLAARIGQPEAVRAVAAANSRNPVWIIVPCHRVIGTDGSLTGYAGGLWRKEWLLNHEQLNMVHKQLSLF
ncbi:MAG: methylated-DNA--[protein]-cysteine S-methyltransferase [Cytophagales bacterium]|nr:methylated-DNA--[protein]-cysteine S-methyltransferase [Bernardetiaceae bacterium]MDW8210857.1 methylated-DNA--[protein]-cysteine S-methyltransferase [Cytophagales bacterium]